MAIREIVPKGAEVLRKKCALVSDVNSASVRKVIRDLVHTLEHVKTLHDFKRGVGLAAPQIGTPLRISVVEYGGKRHVLINPEIVEKSEEKKPIKEGCLSFFEFRAHVPRHEYVKIKAQNEQGETFHLEGRNDFAMLLQHELDHLDGVLYMDHLPRGEKELFRA